MTTDRRELLCDCAIVVLARAGARGLSHHKVDDEAGIARGSTSYYYRTRAALIEAVLERVTQLDLLDVLSINETGNLSIADAAKLIRSWLLEPRIERTIAKHELFLVGARDEELAEKLSQNRKMMVQIISNSAQKLVPHRVPPDELLRAANMASWLIDGIMFTVVRERSSPPPEQELRRDLENILKLATTTEAQPS